MFEIFYRAALLIKWQRPLSQNPDELPFRMFLQATGFLEPFVEFRLKSDVDLVGFFSPGYFSAVVYRNVVFWHTGPILTPYPQCRAISYNNGLDTKTPLRSLPIMLTTRTRQKKPCSIAFRIDQSMREKIEALARDEAVPMTQIVRWALLDYISRHELPRRSRSHAEAHQWERTERQGDDVP